MNRIVKVWNAAGDYTWTCPAGVFKVRVRCTGGGGGGGGGGARSGTSISGGGGGGGGGARVVDVVIDVVPGSTYSVHVGAKGLGGATNGGVSSTGFTGNNGNYSDFRLGGTPLVYSPGAQGGAGGCAGTAVGYSYGGMPANLVEWVPASTGKITAAVPTSMPVSGQGGFGQGASVNLVSPVYENVLCGGSSGAADGGYPGTGENLDGINQAGAGGGGGASEWSKDCSGGDGGSGGTSFSPNGTAGGDGHGPGAGGGGGGGMYKTVGAVSGKGGDGVDGAISLEYVVG